MKSGKRRWLPKRSSRPRTRRARFELLEARRVLAAPTLAAIGEVAFYSGSPMHVPLDGFDADGDVLTFTATSDNPSITTYIPQGNRSMRISVASADGAIDGDMVFELFEDRVPRVTSRIIELAESGFYDGIIFHRVMNNFMIQGGDPTGTGSGGSALGDFDDQFHVDLQHNRSGILSMAKSLDDTNDSQFFITDSTTTANQQASLRNLDFNHSIFGQLVEGDAIREAISQVALVSGTNRPAANVVMTSVEIYRDTQNAVVMLKAPEGYTGEANITITITDALGNVYVQPSFHVTVTPDPVEYSDVFDASPFLADIPEIRTPIDTPVSFNLEAVDADGWDAIYYLDEANLEYNGLDVPFRSPAGLTCAAGFSTSDVTVTPTGGLVGTQAVTVAVACYAEAIDYQVVPIYIVPPTPPASTLDMTLVRDLTPTSGLGEVDALPDDQWIDEWDSFAIEIWAKIDDPGAYGVHAVSTELTYDTQRFTATSVQYGPEFRQHAEAQIDVQTGRVSQIAGSTRGVMVNRSYGLPDRGSLEFFGDDAFLLVARVFFEPNLDGPGVPLGAQGKYCTPVTDLGFAFQNAQVKWNSVDGTNVTAGTLANAELWPVIYDIDDSGKVSLGDLSFFAAAYQKTVGDPGVTWGWASDFDHNGQVTLGDLAFFAPNYLRQATTPGRVTYPSNFPDAWRTPGAAAAPGRGAACSGDEAGQAASERPAAGPSPWDYDWAREQAAGQSGRSSRPLLRPALVDPLMAMYG